jgi:hypothetical protein
MWSPFSFEHHYLEQRSDEWLQTHCLWRDTQTSTIG